VGTRYRIKRTTRNRTQSNEHQFSSYVYKWLSPWVVHFGLECFVSFVHYYCSCSLFARYFRFFRLSGIPKGVVDCLPLDILTFHS